MDTISQREMRNRSGEYLRRTAAGETFEVTNNGVPVARLTPPTGDGATDPGPYRPATAPTATLRDIQRRKASRSSAAILRDTRGDW